MANRGSHSAKGAENLVAAARDGLPFPTTRELVAAADGTRIAVHTHRPDGAHAGETSDATARFPSVVLTNGLSTTARFWKHVAKGLARDHRVVDWSYRGHGESDPATSGDYSLATHVDDLVRVTEAVRDASADGRALLHVAFSMGVTVVLELYRRRPDLVSGMVLIAGGADHPYASLRPLRAPAVRAALRTAFRAITPAMPRAQPLLRRITAMTSLVPLAVATGAIGASAPRDDIAHFFQSVGAMDQRAYWGTLTSLVDAYASDVLPTIRVPVLVIAPERDVMALRSDLHALRDGIPDAEWLLLGGTGHAILLEQGGVIADKIRELSARLT